MSVHVKYCFLFGSVFEYILFVLSDVRKTARSFEYKMFYSFQVTYVKWISKGILFGFVLSLDYNYKMFYLCQSDCGYNYKMFYLCQSDSGYNYKMFYLCQSDSGSS